MLDITSMFAPYNHEDAREISYFLSRYFKSAHNLEPNGKNIFSEVFDRDPPAHIREGTFKIIAEIETVLGKAAADFDDETVDLVLEKLTDYESSLDGELSQNQIEDAAEFFRTTTMPPGRMG